MYHFKATTFIKRNIELKRSLFFNDRELKRYDCTVKIFKLIEYFGPSPTAERAFENIARV